MKQFFNFVLQYVYNIFHYLKLRAFNHSSAVLDLKWFFIILILPNFILFDAVVCNYRTSLQMKLAPVKMIFASSDYCFIKCNGFSLEQQLFHDVLQHCRLRATFWFPINCRFVMKFYCTSGGGGCNFPPHTLKFHPKIHNIIIRY